MPRRKLASLLAVPLVTVLLITGCSVANPDTTPSPTSSPTSSSAPVDPTPSEAPVTDINSLEPGAILTEAQTKEIAPDWKGNLRPYRALDGNVYLVKKDQPLPEVVRNDMQAQTNTITVKTGESIDDQGNTIEQGKGMASRLSSATGKTVVVINYGSVSVTLPNGVFVARPGWLAHNCPLNGEGLLPVGESLDAVLAEVNSLIQAQPNPSQYEIVVQQP